MTTKIVPVLVSLSYKGSNFDIVSSQEFKLYVKRRKG